MITFWFVDGEQFTAVSRQPMTDCGPKTVWNFRFICRRCGEDWAQIVHHEFAGHCCWRAIDHLPCPRHGGYPDSVIYHYVTERIAPAEIPRTLLERAFCQTLDRTKKEIEHANYPPT